MCIELLTRSLEQSHRALYKVFRTLEQPRIERFTRSLEQPHLALGNTMISSNVVTGIRCDIKLIRFLSFFSLNFSEFFFISAITIVK